MIRSFCCSLNEKYGDPLADILVGLTFFMQPTRDGRFVASLPVDLVGVGGVCFVVATTVEEDC